MKGKLIVLEGTDSSGKSTQFKILCGTLDKIGTDYRRLVFPQYDSPSSALVRMYLNGEFGDRPDDVNAYAASAFFAVDRYASYKKDWSKDYNGGRLLMCDRYVTSNAVHQASKLSGPAREGYLEWLFDFEYGRMGLPRPDLVLFLDMPTEFALKLMKSREGKSEDIHEHDAAYLARCRENAVSIAVKYGWLKIDCVRGGKLRAVADIADEILESLKNTGVI